jgi:hypothetical protein
VLAEQTLELGFYRSPLKDQILCESGFTVDGVDEDDRFVICSRAP